MSRGIGKALASAIKDDVQQATPRRGKHIFTNLHRRGIFTLLTLRPCIGVGEIAQTLDISANAAEWHLGALMESGYVSQQRSGRKRVFFPQALVSREEVGLFLATNGPRSRGYLLSIIQKPGMSLSEIAAATGSGRRATSNEMAGLEDVGLVSRVSDGTHQRYYPTRLLPDGAEKFYKTSKDFSEYILRKLAQEGGKPPEVVKRGLDRIIVEVGFASNRFTIEIGINPYITCPSC